MRIAVEQQVIHWEAAAAAVVAAARCAEELGVRVNVAVVDSSGNLSGFLRMPGAFLHSIDVSIDKAYTAAGFGLPTSAWDGVLREHSAAVRDGLSRRPRFVGFGGGFPLRLSGALIGGIGVSGASEEQDGLCALAGCEAVGADSEHG
ncbi:GlcG/HbpS family heme-binding protein [Solimonas soli]|uniref:GlcG/HbpS family heme-binding protein n=1 Tax=Solimonas soli TaxID=413479 RepID=UPI00048A0CC7|nr:heme-binding protein [Solimonas soli]